MYRNAVDQMTRNDIAAAVAAHHELGRDYDGAVAESLIDRIGVEIDKRVDARLSAASSVSRAPAQIRQSGRIQAAWAGAGVGAGPVIGPPGGLDVRHGSHTCYTPVDAPCRLRALVDGRGRSWRVPDGHLRATAKYGRRWRFHR
jgi:hypothetical protein